MMKKILVLMLIALMLLGAVGCAKESDVPQGYKLASNPSLCDYTMYAPDTWVCESTASNYTMTAVSANDKCTVSVAKLEDVYEKTMADYWEKCKANYTFLQNFTEVIIQTEDGPKNYEQVTLGTGDKAVSGYRYQFSGEYSGNTYRYMQVFVPVSSLLDNGLYCITYTAQADHYDTHLDDVNGILANIFFR